MTTFPVYDWTGFTNKPPQAGYGSVINRKDVGLFPGALPCTAEDRAWRVTESDTKSYDSAKCQAWAKRALDPARGPVILDTEAFQTWKRPDGTFSAETITGASRTLLSVVDDIKAVHPKAKVGHYSCVPPRDWLWPVYGNYQGYWEKWSNLNAEIRKTGPGRRRVTVNVDFIAPDLYLLLPDDRGDATRSKALRADWVKFTVRFLTGMLDEARRYGKPVYPVIWPRLHGGGSGGLLWGATIPDDVLMVLLATIRAKADGCFVWGGMEYVATADGSERYTGPVAWETQEWYPRLAQVLLG